MNNLIIESNSVVFAGPFMGEFGWELSHWAPHVRWLRFQYKDKKLITASYPGRQALYYGSVDEFWQLPENFVNKKYDCDCFEALSEDNHYAGLIKYFQEKLLEKYAPENIVWTKTPRGFNKILRQHNHVIFQKLVPSEKADQYCQSLIQAFGDKPVVMLFAREVNRKMFLDILHNRPAYVEDLPNGLPTRNWPRSYWEDLFEKLYAKYSQKVTFVVGGTKGGNCLLNMADKYKDVIDLTGISIDDSLDVTIAFLSRALCSISSQSGPTHVSIQCGCPSFIYGHEQKRHAIDDNPLKTDVVFFETQLGLYNDPSEIMFKEAGIYINALMVEKGLTQSRIKAGGNTFKNAKGDIFEYSPENYDKGTEDWIKNIESETVLLEKYSDSWHQGYINRWRNWFQNIDIKGRILDLGFQNGKTLYQLSQHYPDVKIDALDFNFALSNAIPFYKKLMPNLDDIWIGDCQHVDKPDGYYDYIHCIDFYEHLPPEVYLQSIQESRRLLKDNGTMFVYVGKTDAMAHIHLISNNEVIKDMEQFGFKFVHAIDDLLVFNKTAIPVKKIRKIGIVGVFDNPNSTNIPFGQAFVNAGIKVDVFNYRTIAGQVGIERMNIEIIKFAANYDMVIFCKANAVTPLTIAECSRITKTLWYMMDAKIHLDMDKTYFDMARVAGFNVVTTKEVFDALNDAGIQNLHHIIQGVDPKQFHPVEGIEKKYDVVFIGQKTEKREKIINDIVAAGISTKCYGPKWDAGEMYGEDFNKACAEGRILLAINNTDSDQDGFSDRILRYMATGGCVVTEYTKGLENYFKLSEVWSCELNFIEDIKYLLSDPVFMEEIARNGYQRVLKDYTWDKVSEKIINIVQEVK